MRTIAVVNQKGGCGKTTTSINLAAVAARRDIRTLLVDMDPQGHCAAGLGIPEERIDGGTTAVLLGERIDTDSIFWAVDPKLHILPSTVLLSSVEAGAAGPRADRRLAEFLEGVHDRFDLCLIDCPPSLGLLTMAALQASREAIIPVETGYFSLRGAQRQWDTIEAVVRRLGRDLHRWVLPTIHDPESRISTRILETLKRQFTGRVAPVVIREHESVRESASLGLPVCELEPDGDAQADFVQLLDWLLASAPDTIEPAAANSSRAAEILGRLRDRGPVGQTSPATDTPTPGAGSTLQTTAAPAAAAAPTTPATPDSTATLDSNAPQATTAVPAASVAPTPQMPTTEAAHLQPMADTTTTPASEPAQIEACGVTCTPGGVVFRQPGRPEHALAVRGDFNGWSSIATPMRFDAQTGLFQAIVALPPGTYRYQVVVNGTPGADAYNDAPAEAVGGGAASLLQVEAGQSGETSTA
ncbi:MAG: AAA family ATPase [Phycisphaerales bacterium]|nr:AAA family ATPase [Phycisphaerales bacterium]